MDRVLQRSNDIFYKCKSVWVWSATPPSDDVVDHNEDDDNEYDHVAHPSVVPSLSQTLHTLHARTQQTSSSIKLTTLRERERKEKMKGRVRYFHPGIFIANSNDFSKTSNKV